MPTLLDLAKKMRNLNKNLPEAASFLAAKTALVITYKLTDVTPVDTSRALSNWQLRIGSFADKTIFPYYEGKGGSTEKISEQYANLAAIRNVAGKKPGQTIYVNNNVEYVATDLDRDGHSSQAKPGFVYRAVLYGRLYLKNQKLNLEDLQKDSFVKNFNEFSNLGNTL